MVKKLLIEFAPDSSSHERFRMIREELQRRKIDKVVKTYLIRQEGKEAHYFENVEIEQAHKAEIHYL